jgi:hypothetical protein
MKDSTIDTGGPVFPHAQRTEQGLTRRDWFATFAPEPTPEAVGNEELRDRTANPHGDTYKPSRRSLTEIRADLRYKHADEMIAAGKRSPR